MRVIKLHPICTTSLFMIKLLYLPLHLCFPLLLPLLPFRPPLLLLLVVRIQMQKVGETRQYQ
jgi:hypothetical protein